MDFLPICDFYYNRFNRNLHPRVDADATRLQRDFSLRRGAARRLLLPEAEITVSAGFVRTGSGVYYRPRDIV